MAPPTHWPIEWSDETVDEGPSRPGVPLKAFIMLNDAKEYYCFQDEKHYNYPTIFFRTPLNKNRTNPK